MAKFCQSCGKSLDDQAQFCDGCGATQTVYQAAGAPPGAGTAEEVYSPQDIEKNKVMAGLAYFIFFLPLVACPESRYGRFHANQGLLILIASIGGGIVLAILSAILGLISLYLVIISTLLYIVLYVGITILVIMGLINGLNGKAKPLPVIGHIKLIK
jgi:uncharacterized membrane protein